MHNRLRMIVGSFLVKNLLIHWHEGEKWFWETLFDADEASNSAGWQWIAGCGADASPYFSIQHVSLAKSLRMPHGCTSCLQRAQAAAAAAAATMAHHTEARLMRCRSALWSRLGWGVETGWHTNSGARVNVPAVFLGNACVQRCARWSIGAASSSRAPLHISALHAS